MADRKAPPKRVWCVFNDSADRYTYRTRFEALDGQAVLRRFGSPAHGPYRYDLHTPKARWDRCPNCTQKPKPKQREA